MIKRVLITLVFLIFIFGGVFGWKYYVNSKIQEAMSQREAPPVAVSALEAEETVWQPSIEAVAELQVVQGVHVSGEQPGLVRAIHFQSGQTVEKGALLVELDTSTDRAHLESLLAARELAEVQYKRLSSLAKRNMAPQSDLDEARAKLKQARAQVDQQQTILSKKKIRAPFSGILGLRQVNLGQYLKTGQSVVTLQSLDPIYVNFSLPQQHLDRIHSGQSIHFRVDTWPGEIFQGTITAIDPRVSESSRNVELQATLENKELKLRPGMYGTVSVQLPEKEKVITLPQTAVSYNPYGNVVFVLEDTGREMQGATLYQASRRFVETGLTRGDQVAVTKGIKPKELVVVSGQHKLREGSRVTINNEVLPANSPSPELPDT